MWCRIQSGEGRNNFKHVTKKQKITHFKMAFVAEMLKNLNLHIVTLPPFQTLKLDQELHIPNAMQNVIEAHRLWLST